MSPPNNPLTTHFRTPTEQRSLEGAHFFEIVTGKYVESIDQILDTAKTYFLQEFKEVLFDEENPRGIEERLASAPGLLISLF